MLKVLKSLICLKIKNYHSTWRRVEFIATLVHSTSLAKTNYRSISALLDSPPHLHSPTSLEIKCCLAKKFIPVSFCVLGQGTWLEAKPLAW